MASLLNSAPSRSIQAIVLRAFAITIALCLSPVRVLSAGNAETPNFVVIFTDDQGYQDLGCFGSPEIRTPRIDEMALQGMRFTSFYAQSICGPSRAALMTGCYPMRVAERGNVKRVHPVLHSEEITIAEILKTRGYATACFGKWDLANHSQKNFFFDLLPTRQGFDYFFGTPTSNDSRVDLYRNEQLIEAEADMATLTERYTDEAIRFMREHRGQPFFVYIPHTMPHTKLAASAKFRGTSPRGLYGDVIEEIDFHVGRILDEIRDMGIDDNTYVLFTADNGPWLIKNQDFADGHSADDHGGSAGILRSGKVSSFEGGLRVPTVLWGPERVPAGTNCDKLASTLDVLPTFAALAGAEVPTDRAIDGEDISHLFHGDFAAADPDKAFYYYLRVHLQAVRQGRWKLHLPRDAEPPWAAPFAVNKHIAPADRVGFEQPFLVDLMYDIGETTNVAERHPEVVERLLQLAEAKREDVGDYDRIGTGQRFYDPGPRREESKAWIKEVATSPAAESDSATLPTSVEFSYQEVTGIGHEPGICRRDPSDVIQIDDTFYVYYTKVNKSELADAKRTLYPSGYPGTIWYASSKDGSTWSEQGEALGLGKTGAWDSHGVFTPNIIKHGEKYWLYYTGVQPTPGRDDGVFENNSTSDYTAIGVAMADAAGGPFERVGGEPVLTVGSLAEAFDSYRVDDACLVMRDESIWLYYKGRSLKHGARGPGRTRMGVARSSSPTGPFVKLAGGDAVQDSGHEVQIWPHASGVMSLVSPTGPNGRTLQYAADGLTFTVLKRDLKRQPNAPGLFRSDLSELSNSDQLPPWGIGMVHGPDPYLVRFDCDWDQQ